jgi:hypothetical protein
MNLREPAAANMTDLATGSSSEAVELKSMVLE